MSEPFTKAIMADLMMRSKTNPIQTLERCTTFYLDFEDDYERSTYYLIGFLCSTTKMMRESDQLWKEFTEHEFWKGPGYAPKNNERARAVARFVLDAPNTRHRRYERARVYGRVIDYYLDQSFDPAAVATDLKKKTIKGVIDELEDSLETSVESGSTTEHDDDSQANIRDRVAPKKNSRDARISGDDEAENQQTKTGSPENDSSDETEQPRGAANSKVATNVQAADVDKPYSLNLDCELVVWVGESLNTFKKLQVGQSITMEIRRINDLDEWWQFQAVNIGRPSEVKSFD